jgi:copper resistance protein C
MIRKLIPLCLLAALALVGWPVTGLAHVHLDRSEPAKDAVVGEAPKAVKLWFSGRIEPDFSEIVVTSADGTRVDKGDTSASSNRRELSVSLDDLAPGTYQVNWNAVARDGHRIRGDFSFTVE